MKYNQNKDFRDKLNMSKGKYIVEDQSSFKKPADAWGVKIEKNNDKDTNLKFVGPNILGQLLMELRDNGNLKYKLPNDIFDFLKYIQQSVKL